MSFCENDFIEININVLNSQGMLDFDTFKWIKYQSSKLEIKNFIDVNQSFFDHDDNTFDMCRVCELEVLTKGWQCAEKPEFASIVKKVKFLFEPTFILQKTCWDDVGYDFFKFYLVAASTGIFINNIKVL